MFDFLKPFSRPVDASPRAHTGGQMFTSLNDPAFKEYVRNGGDADSALFNTSVLRCVDLISGAMGSLPFRPVRKEASGAIVEAKDHPLYDLLVYQPNAYQTAYEFKQWMQTRALVEGEAFARIVRNGTRVVGILPLTDVSWRINNMAQPEYTGPTGPIDPADMLHIRGVSWHLDKALSRVKQAARALGLSKDAEEAAVAMFSTGIDPGGILKHPQKLSPEARSAYQAGLDRNNGGAANAGKWLLLDSGMDATPWTGNSARDQQLIERSKHQVEEIARVFGVPRPLMMVDDTSWGSGIEQLAILFVRFALSPWFTAWEQRGRMTLLSRAERGSIWLDFDERELLRGTLKDQSEFFAKALGGTGQAGYMLPDEVRELAGMGPLPNGAGAVPQWSSSNVPPQTS
jgi:HK97 family phage portal protein